MVVMVMVVVVLWRGDGGGRPNLTHCCCKCS